MSAWLHLAVGGLAAAILATGPANANGDTEIQESIRFEQKIGDRVPGDLVFSEASGETVRLRDALEHRPTILVMAWYSCDTLCPITLRNLSMTLANLDFVPGRDFNVVTVSIDPGEGVEDARKTRNTMLGQYGAGETAGWHVLTGNKAQIDSLARAIGFHYAYDAEQGSYAHPAGLVFLRADGVIARYLFGLDNEPKDLKFALMETSQGSLGSVVDQVVLRCHRFDPERGEYTFAVMNALRIAGGGTTALLLGAIGWWLVRERKGT